MDRTRSLATYKEATMSTNAVAWIGVGLAVLALILIL